MLYASQSEKRILNLSWLGSAGLLWFLECSIVLLPNEIRKTLMRVLEGETGSVQVECVALRAHLKAALHKLYLGRFSFPIGHFTKEETVAYCLCGPKSAKAFYILNWSINFFPHRLFLFPQLCFQIKSNFFLRFTLICCVSQGAGMKRNCKHSLRAGLAAVRSTVPSLWTLGLLYTWAQGFAK